MSRWDQARANRKGPIVDRSNWRCENPRCRRKLPETRIGYCSDTCSATHRAELAAERRRRS